MLADCTVASLFGNPLEICSKITGRVIDPPLQVWLVIWRAKQQFIALSVGRFPISTKSLRIPKSAEVLDY